MNFEKTTGYITIPDKYVMYTKLNEDGDQLGGADASGGNEGQKLVWGLQDVKRTLNDNEIEAPQLLKGITLEEDSDREDKKRKHRGAIESKA
jgi:hypothetical protein